MTGAKKPTRPEIGFDGVAGLQKDIGVNWHVGWKRLIYRSIKESTRQQLGGLPSYGAETHDCLTNAERVIQKVVAEVSSFKKTRIFPSFRLRFRQGPEPGVPRHGWRLNGMETVAVHVVFVDENLHNETGVENARALL